MAVSWVALRAALSAAASADYSVDLSERQTADSSVRWVDPLADE